MAEYGRSKHDLSKEFLELPNGIPSHDTFGRLFANLDPKGFKDFFSRWMNDLTLSLNGKTVPIDGKTLRGSLPGAQRPCAGKFRHTPTYGHEFPQAGKVAEGGHPRKTLKSSLGQQLPPQNHGGLILHAITLTFSPDSTPSIKHI